MQDLKYIPEELKQLRQWVCWTSNKIPKNPHNGNNAKSNDPNTWGTYNQAINACNEYGFEGIGFVFLKDGGYFGVDLDHCMDNPDLINEFTETLKTYVEISKSGDGLHLICKGKLPEGGRRHNGIEMYSEGRYFITTGNIFKPQYSEIADCTESIIPLHKKYIPHPNPRSESEKPGEISSDLDDEEVVCHALSSKHGAKFDLLFSGLWEGLYDSQSEADLALCSYLAYWTRKNESQIDRIFRISGMMRPKWDEMRGQNTYGERTIKVAISNRDDCYEPLMDEEN